MVPKSSDDILIPLDDLSASAKMSFKFLHPEMVMTKEEWVKDRPKSQDQIRMELGECFDKMISLYQYYMDMPLEKIKFHVLYDIATYLHPKFNSFPLLYINAMKGSGKTRLLQLHAHLASQAKGRVFIGVNETTLFRTEKHRTLIFDECESLPSKDKANFREYLNVCYKRGSTIERYRKVKTKDGESYEPELFEPFKPIIMANITGMDEVVGDRCLVTILEKSTKPRVVKKLEDFELNPAFNQLTRTLSEISVVMSCRYVSRELKQLWNEYLESIYNDIDIYDINNTNDTESLKDLEMNEFFTKIDSSGIDGRNLELFFPLFSVARAISIETFEEFLEIAKNMVLIKKEDDMVESKDVALFEFVATLQNQGLSYIPLKQLTSKFRTFLGDDTFEEKWINDKWMGRALNRLQLILDKKREASGRIVMLNFVKAKEKLKMFKEVNQEGEKKE